MSVGRIRMRLEIEGQAVLDRTIHGLIDRLDDLSEFWDQVVELWSDYETRMLAAEGAVDGAPRWLWGR
ncbi:MAG: hypothetical protein IT204_21775 [Fimbriimonadaceae bacterium]|nr:hypothetical protein [Fimbriimonadaceae bacterium]